MYKSLDSGKKAGMISLMIITIITIGIASAAPLEIVIEEKVNTTVQPQPYTGSGPSFTYTTNVTGYVNITNTFNEAIYDIWIAVKLVNNSTGCSLFYNGSSSAVRISNTASNFVPDKINKAGVFNTTGANCFIHIPLLKPNEIVSVFYDVNDAAMGINNGAPFTITETYNPAKIPARGEYTWTVTMEIDKSDTWIGKTSLDPSKTITLKVEKYLSNQTSNYGSNNWVALGPISNNNVGSLSNSPYNTPGSNGKLTVTDITNYPYTISFDVTGNYTNSTASPSYFEPFGFAVFSFEVEGNISGTQIVDVFAIGNASVEVTKDGPDNSNIWKGYAKVTNKANGLTYVLNKVTMWATPQDNFQNVISGSSYEWTPGVTLNPGGSWNTSQDGTKKGISFQYDKVPIIWANAIFKLVKGANGWDFSGSKTLNDTNATYGSNFIVIEKIYIIGTYLVKVTKHVLYNSTASTDTNVFDIYLVVENIGGEESPYVYVYDLIPQNFEEYNWNDNWNDVGEDGNWVNKSSMLAGNGSETLSNFLGTYTKGHYWRLMPIAPGANGDGSYDDWQEISDNKTVVIFYQLAGTGDFKVLDAFIVGIDPMYSLNEQTAPKITLVSGAKMTNYETTLATITFASMGALLVIYIRRNGRNGA
ncbi:MAG: hypothetical protein QXX76_00410 [Archaeoglobaceae archaeon]